MRQPLESPLRASPNVTHQARSAGGSTARRRFSTPGRRSAHRGQPPTRRRSRRMTQTCRVRIHRRTLLGSWQRRSGRSSTHCDVGRPQILSGNPTPPVEEWLPRARPGSNGLPPSPCDGRDAPLPGRCALGGFSSSIGRPQSCFLYTGEVAPRWPAVASVRNGPRNRSSEARFPLKIKRFRRADRI